MARGAYIVSSPLKELVIEVTQKCPMQCIYCSTNAGPDKECELPINTVKRVIVDAAKMGVETIAISGGEPLSSKIRQIIRLRKKAVRMKFDKFE